MSNPLITPHLWTPGPSDATAANLQTLSDAAAQLQGVAAATGGMLDFTTLVQVTAQTGLTTGFHAITFDTTSEIVDSSLAHDVASFNTRITPKTPCYIEVGGLVAFDANATGYRALEVRKNGAGAGIPGTQASTLSVGGAAYTCLTVPSGIWVPMNGTTDYVELWGFANTPWDTVVTGSAACRFSVKFVHA